MADELSPAEAAKFFNSVSKAINDSDPNKLTELMEQKEPEVETPEVPPVVDPPAPEEPETPDNKDDKAPEEVPTPDDPLAKAGDADVVPPVAEDEDVAKLREQLKKLEKDNQHLRSQAGRVPSVQRKLKELDKKLEELRAAQTSPSSQPSSKISPKVAEKLKGIQETDPELAKAITEALGAVAEASDEVASDLRAKQIETVEMLRQNEISEHQAYQADRLLEMYPNAPEVFRSPSWVEWKKSQTAGIVRLAESDTADEVAKAFNMYAEDMVRLHPELATPSADKGESTPPVTDEAAKKAAQIEAERKKAREKAANVSNPPASTKSAPDNDRAYFEKISEEIRKQISG
jgi:DNA repair exonuclease SbcCD ATPase subunit